MVECSIQGCSRRVVVREQGWCLAHYKRWRRRGTVHDLTPEDYFFAHVAQDDECWVWTASTTREGYGKFCINKQTLLAHRWIYEFMRVEIPDGLKLDHLCGVRACVNPWHLEPVTQRVNLLRSNNFIARNAAKTHCPQGHPYDEANTYVHRGRRNCRICHGLRPSAVQSAGITGAEMGR